MEHPNVTQMVEYIENETKIYIITELVRDGNLLDFNMNNTL